jgi:ABC-2 type transport system permease protein
MILETVRHSLIRLRALLAKEFRQVLRDPRMRFFVIVPPLVQLVIFGYAASFDVRQAQVGVVEQSHSQGSRELLGSVAATGHFTLHYFDNMNQARTAVDRGDVRAVIHIAARFEQEPVVQLIADGSDSNSAQMIVGELSRTLQQHARLAAAAPPLLAVEDRAWFNPNLDDRDYFVPGIMANVVLIATMILTAMTVVRERELGTLERLLVTPVARLEFLIAKMVPVACIGLADVALITGVAVFWFDVPLRGGPGALLLGSLLFLGSTLGLGLLVSSYASTQQQAMLLAFFVIMPTVILSGFAFPIANMPQEVQLLTWLDPLRYYLVVVRDIFLKGAGISDHLFEYAMMTVLACSALSLSMLRLGRAH